MAGSYGAKINLFFIGDNGVTMSRRADFFANLTGDDNYFNIQEISTSWESIELGNIVSSDDAHFFIRHLSGSDVDIGNGTDGAILQDLTVGDLVIFKWNSDNALQARALPSGTAVLEVFVGE